MNFSKILTVIKYAFFPKRCMSCGEVIYRDDEFCKRCSQNIKPASSTNQYAHLEIGKLLVTFLYCEPIRGIIAEFKFKNNIEYGTRLATICYDKNKEQLKGYDFIVAVPMGKNKRERRKYNHTYVIASRIAELSKIEFRRNLLKQIKENKKQHSLTAKERKENVVGAYKVSENFEIKGSKILLVDDIVTTGSTVSECCKILKASGASVVDVFAFAQSSYEVSEKEEA